MIAEAALAPEAELRVIRGLTWDHPRGYDCLTANVPAFERANPGVTVRWDKRSLHRFGAEPLAALADRYDLLVIDHPFVGEGATSGLLRDLRAVLEPGGAEAILERSVGPTGRCYRWGKGVYALPTDAAAQVAAYRPDLMDQLGLTPPHTWRETLDLAARARRHGLWIATPVCPTDAMGVVVTLSANLGRPLHDRERFLEGLGNTMALIEELVAAGPPEALDWDPVQCFDAMTSGDTIAYVPFAFGYSNYARGGERLRFTDIAGPGADPRAGAILGGAGCAVTAGARDLPAIAAYLRFLHDEAHQAGAYFDAGGQPAAKAAWDDPAVNAAAHGFFADTRETLDKAYVRPRAPGFVDAFEQSGVAVNRRLNGELSRTELIDTVRRAFEPLSWETI